MIKKIIIAVVILAGVVFWWQDRPVSQRPRVLAANIPTQQNITSATPFQYKDYRVVPLATFQIKARVLGKENYYLGREATLSPVDLTLGWGPMSDSRVLDKISISQSNRFYYWYTSSFPIPRRQIETNSANMHMIPANKSVARRLSSIRAGQVVQLQGYLVRIEASDGWRWQSSLTRGDVGAGSCELIWVQSVSTILIAEVS